jgi:acetyltransferase-like isoleucine patch superfamily enzyme
MTIGIDQFSLFAANRLLNHFDLNRKRGDIQKTTRDNIKKTIEDWVILRFGNREATKMIEGAVLGFDERTASVLVGCGVGVLHCVSEQEVVQESWDENFIPIEIKKTVQLGVPYYPNLSMSPSEKKEFFEKNESSLLLGNGAVHSSAQAQPDLFLGMGSIVGPFSWIGPKCQLGNMTTISSHAMLSHDVIVGDYSSVGENVSIHSGVRIGAGVTIGSGAVVFRGVVIDPGVTVQPCQVVRTNLRSGGFTRVKF